VDSSTGFTRLQHRFHLFLARTALGIAGFGYAWLAWIDAPVNALVVVLMGVATVLALTCVVAAATAWSWALSPPAVAPERAARREQRSRRLALAALVLAGLFTAAACCLTLPFKQSDTDSDDGDDTATRTHATWLMHEPSPVRRLSTPAA
jgi:hypothetical protein